MVDTRIAELHLALTELEDAQEALGGSIPTLRLRKAIAALEDVPPTNLAHEIRLIRRKAGAGTPFEFTIDGKPFPWHLATDPDIRVSYGVTPRISITLLCEELVVVDTFDTEAPELTLAAAPAVPGGIRNTEIHDRLAGKAP